MRKMNPIERIYPVTFVDGTNRKFVGTRLEMTTDHVLIWNKGVTVVGFKATEYKEIQ